MSNTNASNLFLQRLKATVVHITITARSQAASSEPKRSGTPWRDMPERQGNWWAAHNRFQRWTSAGTLESIMRHLQGELDAGSRIDWS